MATHQYVVPTDVPDKYNYEARLNDFDTVRLRTWHSTVSIRFVYATRSDDAIDLEIPRLTYLPHAFPKLREYFSLSRDADITLTVVDNQALAHHLPVGLLYDLYAEMAEEPSNAFLTGRLTLNVTLTKFRSIQDIHNLSTSVWDAMKQNEFLRRYSIRRIQNLTPEQHERLESAFLNLTLSEYMEASQVLMNVQGLRYIPLRLYLTPTHAVQDLITPKTEGDATTLSHAMRRLAPELSRLGADKVNIILHGVVLEWHIKLLELLDEATYVDGWLYLTVQQATTRKNAPVASQEVQITDVVAE